MLVLGEINWYETPYGVDGGSARLTAQKVWWGSAKCTEGSRNHLEIGFLSHDAELRKAATDFVADVISLLGTAPIRSCRSRAEHAQL